MRARCVARTQQSSRKLRLADGATVRVEYPLGPAPGSLRTNGKGAATINFRLRSSLGPIIRGSPLRGTYGLSRL